ncbi:Protein of unknown function [Bacillus wiedmannii]|nr:Protein of unknown function [Bacillus wiedmannii]
MDVELLIYEWEVERPLEWVINNNQYIYIY